jgi:arylsulfatase A
MNPVRIAQMATILFVFIGSPCRAAAPPNVVILFADDLGYGDIGCYNPDSKIPTPHIDGLAADGMRFVNAYSAAAVCVPSRHALMTGRYPFRDSPLRWGTHPTIPA